MVKLTEKTTKKAFWEGAHDDFLHLLAQKIVRLADWQGAESVARFRARARTYIYII